MSRRRSLAILFGLALTAGLFAVSFLVTRPLGRAGIPGLTPLPGAASPAVTPHPLSIAAVREHPVAAGPVETVRSIPSRGGCTTSIISYRSDGLRQYALLQIPATPRPATGYPVVILAHGYIAPASYRTDGTDYQGFINAYCQAGYIVVKPDYRGNGNSEGTAGSGHFMPDYTYDVLNLVASLPNLPQADAQNVALVGHSLGGAVVLRAAVASHGLPIKAYVLAGGVVGSWSDLLNDWPPSQIPADLIPVRAAILQQFGTPDTNPGFWHDGSSINYVDAITAPVQIQVGSVDEVVPPSFSAKLDAALTVAGKSHEYYVYPGGDHQFTQSAQRQGFLQRSITLFNRTLK